MAENSTISWTDHTFNPWHGCVKVSSGCRWCYAEVQNKRFGESNWGPSSTRLAMQESYWEHPVRWNQKAAAAGVRKRVFCGSMCDWAEIVPATHPSFAMMNTARQRLFDVIEKTPHLDWQLLTKRPENIMTLVPPFWQECFPLNVWVGASVEDQKSFNNRIGPLLAVPALVHFLSAEPLLSGIDMEDYLAVEWVICGGESGLSARRMNPDWARSLKSQCAAAGVAFFFKQAGSVLAKEWGCSDTKGDKLTELPEDLRLQEFPETALTRALAVRAGHPFPKAGGRS